MSEMLSGPATDLLRFSQNARQQDAKALPTHSEDDPLASSIWPKRTKHSTHLHSTAEKSGPLPRKGKNIRLYGLVAESQEKRGIVDFSQDSNSFVGSVKNRIQVINPDSSADAALESDF